VCYRSNDPSSLQEAVSIGCHRPHRGFDAGPCPPGRYDTSSLHYRAAAAAGTPPPGWSALGVDDGQRPAHHKIGLTVASPDVAPPHHAFIIVGGRRWRATDPDIPATLRQQLVNELMAARRAVRDARNPRDLRNSRRRVHDAKIALGERGHPWWLPARTAATSRRIEAATRALLRSRQPGLTICPSDVARIAGGKTWRSLLPRVRERAVAMMERGELEILRRGRVVTRNPTEGVLRYRLP
jgi:hypothetical protein